MKRIAALVALVSLSLPLPRAALAGPAPEARTERLDEALSLLEDLRPSAAVRAAAALTGTDTVTPAIVEPAVTGLPGGLTGPLGTLLGAIDAAERTLGRMDGRKPDTVVLAAATEVITDAIERSMPALRSVPSGATTEAACDVVNQPPLLCVGGTGPNTYTADVALLIDLGGDDLHANSAGGADPQRNGLPVSVTIDLGGADTYRTTLPTASGSRVAQGAGHLGGVGVLVDAAGSDDVYEATATAASTSAHAQGAGIAGAGVLTDMGGDDTYRLSNLAPASEVAIGGVINSAHYATGQGWGMLGGLGVALDASGNDTALVESRPAMGNDFGLLVPGLHVYAQGFGAGYLGGVGVFAGGGGRDDLTLLAEPASVDPAELRGAEPPRAWAAGFGFASLGGAGLVYAGSGDTTSTARAVTRAPQTQGTEVHAFGVAVTGGLGAIVDTGGDDLYLADADARAEQRRTAADGCGCLGARVSAKVEGIPAFPDDGAVTRANGYGETGARGVQRDLGGDDRYVTSASSVAIAEARDERRQLSDSGEEIGAEASAVAESSLVRAQGFGTSGGTGLLEDAAGNDTYETRSTTEASAEASAYLAAATIFIDATAEPPWTTSQGYGGTRGFGELRDLGGRDRYVSAATSSATTVPAGYGEAGAPIARVQAAVDTAGTATLVDLDLGSADVFVSAPAQAICTGKRGDPVWVDCGLGVGTGLNQ